MADYLSLDEAAAKLGVATDRLVDLKNQGQVRAFRDGSSWKFPVAEIDRLADDLAAEGAGSGMLADSGLNPLKPGSGNIIGGDASEEGDGSDLEIGNEALAGGSDVNLVADLGSGSDVSLVPSPSDSGLDKAKPDSEIGVGDDSELTLASESELDLQSDILPEIDSKELRLDEPAILNDSNEDIDLSLDTNEGSTGPSLKEQTGSTGPTIGSDKAGSTGPTIDPIAEGSSVSSLNLGAEPEDELALAAESDLSFTGAIPDEDSDEIVLGGEEDDGLDALASSISGNDVLDGSASGSNIGTEQSSLELMPELEMASPTGKAGTSSADVLSELDLLGAESGGSGLITGDSENLLASSGLGSSLGEDLLGGSEDDALADDDDLVIADDDEDLVIDSSGTDISVAGDSGINLMSPSDSGLSLESEPLDLAGSSISALDLGAELSEGSDPSGSAIEAGIAGDSSGSMVDFQADEEFQLSPSGVGLEADFESGSQVIEVEDSEAIGEAVEFADAGVVAADPFAAEPAYEAEAVAAEPIEAEAEEAAPVGLETSAARRTTSVPTPGASVGYEVPFTVLQCITLFLILIVLTVGGMLMTDLIRNIWVYSETSTPVSSLTDALADMILPK